MASKLYPRLNEEPSAPPPDPVVFRMEEINRFRDELAAIQEKRYCLVKRYANINTGLTSVISGLGTASVACGATGAILASTGIGIIPAVPLAVTAAISGALAVALQAPKKFYEKKRAKHQKILESVRATADSVVKRISRIIADSNITDKEFSDLMADRSGLYNAIKTIKKIKSGDDAVSEADIEEKVKQRIAAMLKKN